MQYRENRRVQKEYLDFTKHANSDNIRGFLFQGNLFHWKACFKGPVDTPYQGGTFQIDIKIPHQYPYQPPQIKFDNKVWHPNISSKSGLVCLDITQAQWSPALTIRVLVLSVQNLLDTPNFENPMDNAVAGEYEKDKNLFQQHARDWTQKYATAHLNQASLKRLVEMGFPPQVAIAALQKNQYVQEGAIAYLLGQNYD